MKINKVAKYIYSEKDINDLIKEDLEKKNIDTENIEINYFNKFGGGIEITAEVLEDGD